MTLLECIEWAQDPIQTCAGSPIIPAANFQDLATTVAAFDEVSLSDAEVLNIFTEQAKRFSACGANFSERFGVLRKNPKGGWAYLVTLLTQ